MRKARLFRGIQLCLVITGGVLLLSYLGVTLRKTSRCDWKLLGKFCQSFCFLIIEFSIFNQVKYLNLKVLLATSSDGSFQIVSLLTASAQFSAYAAGERSGFLGGNFREMVK